MKKKYIFTVTFQLAAVIACGIISKDSAFAVANASIGVVFNFLVSLNIPLGFIFGTVYAITSGIIAFKTCAFATFAFMIFLQAPIAIYSYIKWKSKNASDRMFEMSNRARIITAALLLSLGAIMYFVLNALNSNSVIFDDMFFMFSVTACLLLALALKAHISSQHYRDFSALFCGPFNI